MPRVKRGVTTNRRHKKVLKAAKGYRQRRKNVFKLAKNAVMKAGQNAYRDRRLKKRSFSRLWITRINAACKQFDIQYSRFIYGLELANIQLNRKMLSELATNHIEVFEEIVKTVKGVLPAQGEGPDLEALKKRYSQTSDKKEASKASDEKKEAKAKKSDEKVAVKEGKKEVKKAAAKKTQEAKADKEEK